MPDTNPGSTMADLPSDGTLLHPTDPPIPSHLPGWFHCECRKMRMD